MPRNGSGTYQLPAGNPVVTGTVISSTTQNTTMSDVATALTNSIAKDGQTTPTSNLPMGGFKHTGAGNATATGQYLVYGQDGMSLGDTTIAGTLTVEEGAEFEDDVTMTAATMKWAKGADVASATALPLINDGNYFDVTGATTITSFDSLGVGSWIGLHFDGALTLTHNATDLVLPGGANITTAAGDEAIFVEYASGNWRCVSYSYASGAIVFANAATFNAGTNETQALNSKIVRENTWVYGSAVATTSGDAIEVLGPLPSWATEVELIMEGVSLSGTDFTLIQISTGGSYVGTTYQSAASFYGPSYVAPVTSTDGLEVGVGAAAVSFSGVYRIVKGSGDVWRGTFIGDTSSGATLLSSGKATLAGAIGRLRVNSSGSNTFDAGSVIGRYR